MAGGRTWHSPRMPYDGASAVQGGVRTPKLRMSTETGPWTTPGTALRGTTTRGLGHRWPGWSSMCSQISAVLLGAASMFKNSSDSLGEIVRDSRCGSVPYC